MSELLPGRKFVWTADTAFASTVGPWGRGAGGPQQGQAGGEQSTIDCYHSRYINVLASVLASMLPVLLAEYAAIILRNWRYVNYLPAAPGSLKP